MCILQKYLWSCGGREARETDHLISFFFNTCEIEHPTFLQHTNLEFCCLQYTPVNLFVWIILFYCFFYIKFKNMVYTMFNRELSLAGLAEWSKAPDSSSGFLKRKRGFEPHTLQKNFFSIYIVLIVKNKKFS